MKGLSGLWRNECFKIYRQTANRVIIIIALALSLLTPVFNLLISGALDYFDRDFDDVEYWRENAEVDLSLGNYLSDSDWEARVKATEFYSENGISQSGWKYQAFYDGYRTLLFRRYAFGYYLDGKIGDNELADAIFWDYYYADGTPKYGDFGGFADDRIVPSDGEEYTEPDVYGWFETFDVEAEYENVKAGIKEIESTLANLTVKDYANARLIELQAERTEKKNELGEIRTKVGNGDVTERDVLIAELEHEGAEYMVSIYEHMSKTNVPEEESDWLVSAAAVIGESARSSLVTVAVSEEEFYDDTMRAYNYGTDDYEKYCENVENTRANARRALMTVDYAIENGIPLPEMTPHSAKMIIRDSLSSVASIVVIAMIIVTANNIALEYSSGTIRLLLIRPRKRSKIILSKFLALFTVGVIVSVAVFIVVTLVSTIANAAVYGEWDTLTPDLICTSRVIKINSLLYSLAKLFLPLLSGGFLLSIGFMMAVVTRKAALAIIAPVVINSMSSILQLLSMNYAGEYPILKYTVLPYFDLGQYLVSPVANYSLSGLNYSALINGGMSTLVLSSNLSALTGAIVIILHFVLIYALAFWAFSRQQIKS